jgi:hypothetical protein
VPLYVLYFSGEVVLYNIFYEVFTVCTSIVAETPEGNFDMNRTVTNPNPNQPNTLFCLYVFRQAFPRTKSGFWSFSWVKLHTLAICSNSIKGGLVVVMFENFAKVF